MIIHLRVDGHQRAHRDALMAGLSALGVDDLGSDVVVAWGWRGARELRAQGHRVLVFERGYLGDRMGRYSSIAWNGLNGRATFPEYPDDGGERFRACGFHMKPRRVGGEHVLLVGQVRTDAAVAHTNICKWYETAADAAQKAYGLPVVFRPHPDEVSRGMARAVAGTRMETGTLADALAGAAHVITFSSNTAVESLIAGIDTVAVDCGSMAYGVAGMSIGERANFDARADWAYKLAWKQWTLEEIASGDALMGLI